AGVAVAHIHGGDRAEGIADEAMRHAITKLAHLHLPATEMSAARIRRMGERPDDVIVIGSPAIDGLSEIPPIDDDALEKYAGVRECPGALVLLHPAGRDDATEAAAARSVIDGVRHAGAGTVVALQPNHDAGRHAVLAELQAARDNGEVVAIVPNMPRALFVGLLKRMATHNGVLVGNSSAALIEAAAVPIAAVDVGPRQAGRERAGNVVHAADETAAAIAAAVQRAREMQLDGVHPYGDGVAGMRAAEAIAARDAQDAGMLRKRFVD
ncbi:MAG: UDP-N-acetylglucosamine 2-epimerase, partial [Planctomycetota bacterium]